MVSPLSRTSFDTREHSAFRLHVRRCVVVCKCAEIQRVNSVSGKLDQHRKTMQTEEKKISRETCSSTTLQQQLQVNGTFSKQLQASPFKHRKSKSGVTADENCKHQHHACTKTSDIDGLITRQPFCGPDHVVNTDMGQIARAY